MNYKIISTDINYEIILQLGKGSMNDITSNQKCNSVEI